MKIVGIFIFLSILFLNPGCENPPPPAGENFQEYINENAVKEEPEPPTLSENALIDVHF